MEAEDIARLILAMMERDNGGRLTVDATYRAFLVEYISQAMSEGMPLTFEDRQLLAVGDADEREAKFAAFPSYHTLSRVLDDIFDGPGATWTN